MKKNVCSAIEQAHEQNNVSVGSSRPDREPSSWMVPGPEMARLIGVQPRSGKR